MQEETEVVTYGNKDVNSIIETFSELFGNTKTTRYDRWAAARMMKSSRYGGAEGIVLLMRMFHSVSSEQYAPSVSSVSQFDAKLPAIVTYIKKKGQLMEEIQL